MKASQPRILVIRPDRIGDVILSTPVLKALRHRFPQAYLGMLVRSYTAPLLEHLPLLDVVLVDDPGGIHRGFRGLLRQARRLRRYKFDIGLMLFPTPRAAWLMRLGGVKRRIGVGQTLYQMLTGTESVSRNDYRPLRHESDYCLDLARRIGADSSDLAPCLTITPPERHRARQGLEELGLNPDDLLIGIHPGNLGSAPNWPVERYHALAQRLVTEGKAQLVVSGGPDEQALMDQVIQGLGNRARKLPSFLSVRQLMAFISWYDLLISSSTGPLHIAAALAIPSLGLFCRVPACSPRRWAPQHGLSLVLTPQNPACPGCQVDDWRLPHWTCRLLAIEVDDVCQAVHELLAE